MASTYSDLKIELIGTGEQVGTWGATTNTNLGTAIEDAITGSANVSFSSADVTLTLTNANSAQTARNLRLVCTGTSGGARNLILGSGCQINKLYLVQNDLADTVTIKNTAGTGVAIAAGKKKFVFNNGTNVVLAESAPVISLTTDVTGILPIANGGTSITSFGTGVATALGQNVTGSGGIVLATSPTLTTPALGTPSSGTLTSCTGLPLSTGVTGTLPVANGGTGAASLTANNVLLGNGTSAVQVVAPGTNGNVLTSNGTTWTSAVIPTPAALSTASGAAPSFSARAWVNFDGQGAVAIRASGNVSTVTDNGTGDYTVTFTTAMPDANYSTCANAGPTSASGNYSLATYTFGGTYSSSEVQISTYRQASGSPTLTDYSIVSVSVLR